MDYDEADRFGMRGLTNELQRHTSKRRDRGTVQQELFEVPDVAVVRASRDHLAASSATSSTST